MPPLVVFGWRWGIGSDDLVIPSVFLAVMEIVWLAVVVAVYAVGGCWVWNGLEIYFFSSVVLGSLHFVCDCVIARLSMKGSIMNVEPRKRVPLFLGVWVFLFALRIIFGVVGTYLAFSVKQFCEDWELTAIKVLVILQWSVVWFVLLVVFFILDVFGYRTKEPQIDLPPSTTDSLTLSSQIWEQRCRCLYCCNQGIDDNVFKTVAHIFATVFEDLDLVLSDILMGLMLLYDQDRNESIASLDLATGNSQAPGSRQFWMTPNNAVAYMKYALACYSWPLYAYTNLPFGCFKLCPYFRCCSCLRNSPNLIEGDNCCHCDTAALKKMSGLTDDDIIYISFHNRVYEIPFYVAVDRRMSSIIVAIRGTLSFVDVLTDLSLSSSSLDHPELPSTFHAHKGMIETAKFIEQKLEEKHILAKAMEDYPTYSIVITGHSLGAGTAAILAAILRPKFPSLRCFCFSPPPILMSPDFAQESDDFIMSVVIGCDLIPRASFETVNDLNRRLVEALLLCQRPKFKIILNRCLGFLCIKDFESENPQQGIENQVSPVFTERYRSSNVPFPKMYLPGKILHVYFRDDENTVVDHKWSNRDAFQKLVVTPAMLKDHMPDVVYLMLKKLVAQLE